VERDFSLMAATGINAVRTYTVPPLWLLDSARKHGLYVMIGLPVERSAGFFDYPKCAQEIERMVRSSVRACGGHPAALCYTIGNEIPSSIVRWQGRGKLEKFLHRLYCVAKEEDPGCLVTYANYPSTEYLRLPFLDFVSFNVYLESQERLEAYLAQLHNIASDRPLIMGEFGLDSLRHGQEKQAKTLEWQVRTAFAAGCAGTFVYSWTDEWFRGGAEVHDWKFGLVDRRRNPKPALDAVQRAFAGVPFPQEEMRWPKVSVIVCSHNGARTIADTFHALQKLEYPNYEVIVVDDGSSDNTAVIARQLGFRVLGTSSRGLSSALPGCENCKDWAITKPNRGLSNARNLGMYAATGQIVAYVDDDAYPDPHWLQYLAAFFQNPRSAKYGGVGGPNIAPPNDGLIADCVAHAPGGPIHVLLTNREAEHIPGCNMAFRKCVLKAVGGFDPQFHVAGDDVDVCWRLRKEGWLLGFSPAAVVWHHRRNSVMDYWKQQKGYGKAESMLERKWPDKYNVAGHAVWSGRIYTNGLTYLGWRVRRIYHGQWGTAPFQSLYEPAPSAIESLPMLPEWYLIVLALAGLSALGLAWKPLQIALAPLIFCIGLSVVQAMRSAHGAVFDPMLSIPERRKRQALTASLYLMQPLARFVGRVRCGLTLWRHHAPMGYAWPRSWKADIWTPDQQSMEERLEALEAELRRGGCASGRGSHFDSWDLEVRGGLLGAARLRMAVEKHGSGRELLRIHCEPRFSVAGLLTAVFLGILACMATWQSTWAVYVPLGAAALWIGGRAAWESAAATGAFLTVVRKIKRIQKTKIFIPPKAGSK
jgi:GT2 family glycosyltransferase